MRYNPALYRFGSALTQNVDMQRQASQVEVSMRDLVGYVFT